MSTNDRRFSPLQRRAVLRWASGTGIVALLPRCTTDRGGTPAHAPAPSPVPAPAPAPSQAPAPDPADSAKSACLPTASNIEGPFYKAGAPRRRDIASSLAGTPLIVRGRVVDARCQPVPGARLDFWQANRDGRYDNEGYRLRGEQLADSEGAYELSTIVPGHYKNGATYRPAHIHVKVHPAHGPPLTTQLYFPGDPYNEGDPFIDQRLIMVVDDRGEFARARFDFVL